MQYYIKAIIFLSKKDAYIIKPDVKHAEKNRCIQQVTWNSHFALQF